MVLHEYLKQHTAQLHQQLDRHSALTRLTQTDLSPQEYGDILLGLYHPQRQLEQVLLPVVHQQFPEYDFNPRFSLIEQDLDILEQPFTQIDKAFTWQCSAAQIVGILYVLEGSKLGGRFILSNLKKVFPELPHHFFSSSDLSAKSFRSRLEQLGTDLDETEYSGAAEAAQQAFELYITANGSVS